MLTAPYEQLFNIARIDEKSEYPDLYYKNSDSSCVITDGATRATRI